MQSRSARSHLRPRRELRPVLDAATVTKVCREWKQQRKPSFAQLRKKAKLLGLTKYRNLNTSGLQRKLAKKCWQYQVVHASIGHHPFYDLLSIL